MEENHPVLSESESAGHAAAAIPRSESAANGGLQATAPPKGELHTLREQVRKLTALCQVGHLLQREDRPAYELLQEIAPIVATGCEYPEVTGVRIRFGELKAATGNFTDAPCRQMVAFFTKDGQKGTIELAHPHGLSTTDQSALVAKEKDLLETVAKSLRAYFERQQSELAVKQQAQIIDQIHDSVVSTDLDGNVLTWNAGAERLFGFSASEAVGRHISFFYEPSQHEFLQDRVIAPLKAKGDHEVEVRMRRKSGELFQAHVRLSLLRDSQGAVTGMIGYSMDVTDRKRAEQALLVRSRQQAALAQLGQAALAGGTIDALLDRAAALVAEHLEVEYCKILELLPGERAFRLRAGVGWKPGLVGRARVGAGANSQAGYTLGTDAPVIVEDLQTDRRFRGPPLLKAHGVVSGLSVIIGGHVPPFGVLGAHTRRHRRFSQDDINFVQAMAHVLAQAIAGKEATAALQERERAFRTLAENLPGVVYRVSARAGRRILFFSKAAEQILGFSPEELAPGKYCPVESVMVAEDRLAVQRVLRQALGEGSPFTLEYRIRHKDGSLRYLLERGVPVAGEDGKLSHIDGVILDQTERKRLESQVLEISEREQRRVGQDLHDSLSQHLRGIVYLSHALEQNLARSSPPQAKEAGRISRLMDEAIVQTRALARGLAPLSLEADGLMFALKELAANTRTIYGVSCQLHCPRRVLIHKHSSAIHLYRIAQEAVQNALRHGEASQITIHLGRKGNQIKLAIRDNGKGMPAQSAKTEGMGLKIMGYRAGIIGAGLSVTRANGGTVVTCTLAAEPFRQTRATSCR